MFCVFNFVFLKTTYNNSHIIAPNYEKIYSISPTPAPSLRPTNAHVLAPSNSPSTTPSYAPFLLLSRVPSMAPSMKASESSTLAPTTSTTTATSSSTTLSTTPSTNSTQPFGNNNDESNAFDPTWPIVGGGVAVLILFCGIVLFAYKRGAKTVEKR